MTITKIMIILKIIVIFHLLMIIGEDKIFISDSLRKKKKNLNWDEMISNFRN
jgi:uncharacterized protein with HEPN domain